MIALKSFCLAIAAMLCLLWAGCAKTTSAADVDTKNDLLMITFAYGNFWSDNESPPAKLDDIRKYMSSDKPLNLERYTVIWGCDLREDNILAYEPDAPQKGGWVGSTSSVRKVTAEEFKTLTIAAPALPLDKQEVAASLSAKDYLADYKKLENHGMWQKYGGRLIEVKGIVKGFNPSDKYSEIQIVTPGDEGIVYCHMASKEALWKKLSRRQEVTVRGRLKDGVNSYALHGCAVVAQGPNMTITITAEELARDLAANYEEADKKYQGRSFIVTGEIVKTEPRTEDAVAGELKGAGKETLSFVVNVDASTRGRIVPGAKVKLYGEMGTFGSIMTNCRLIED